MLDIETEYIASTSYFNKSNKRHLLLKIHMISVDSYDLMQCAW